MLTPKQVYKLINRAARMGYKLGELPLPPTTWYWRDHFNLTVARVSPAISQDDWQEFNRSYPASVSEIERAFWKQPITWYRLIGNMHYRENLSSYRAHIAKHHHHAKPA